MKNGNAKMNALNTTTQLTTILMMTAGIAGTKPVLQNANAGNQTAKMKWTRAGKAA